MTAVFGRLVRFKLLCDNGQVVHVNVDPKAMAEV